MDDATMAQMLAQDLSVGTDEFREGLLARCLEVLGQDGPRELSDESLEAISAAGVLAPEPPCAPATPPLADPVDSL